MMFRIIYGLTGGYNDIVTEEVEADSLARANLIAYEAALQMFESYGVFEHQRGMKNMRMTKNTKLLIKRSLSLGLHTMPKNWTEFQ
mgnify:CR=1 FL=1